MTANDFIKLREKDWQRLETLINRNRGRNRLSAAEIRELGALYRAVTSDLALARRDYADQRVTAFLNQLLTKAHSFIYQEEVNDWGVVPRYFVQDLPRTFRQTWLFTLIAFLLFMVPATVGYTLAERDPDFADMLGLAEQRAMLADQETWTQFPIEERPYASTFIMTNNIRVALLAFGGGALFGVFSVYAMAFNGLFIGAVLGLSAHYGMDGELWSFVIGHGVIELSVIFIAGGAGLQLGWALLNPGKYTRRDALLLAAKRAVILVLSAIPLLIIAGVIEGFLSPTDAPFRVKALVGVGSGVLLYSYLILAGREADADAPPPPASI